MPSAPIDTHRPDGPIANDRPKSNLAKIMPNSREVLDYFLVGHKAKNVPLQVGALDYLF
jgi:hypothetical protein